jgi:UBX domain-containing protein 1
MAVKKNLMKMKTQITTLVAKKGMTQRKQLRFPCLQFISGLQIQDPNKKKKTGNAADIVQDVFENAKKHGAKPREDMPPEEKEKFTGSGYKLGNTVEPSRIETAAPKPVKKGPVNKKISFYKNGFTIDDGPLRNYNDPQNASFLSDINKGIIPRELEHEAQNGDMQISLEDKKHEDWKEPPKPKVVPFSGHGNTLSSTSTSTYAAPEVSSSPVKPVQFSVDESQPITTLQIRLHDGTRMVAKFNQTHTVADVRRFVEMAKKTPPFDLMTSFPTKVLADSNQSLKDAGLINATVVQKLK